jgi:hypothetical protein
MKKPLYAAALLLFAAAGQASAAQAAPRPSDATYSYTLTYEGAAIGNSIVAIDSTKPGTLVVKEIADYVIPSFTATSTMRYDTATLRETAYSADFNLASGAQHTNVTMKSGTMSVFATPGGTVDIPADPSAPLELVGDNLAGSAVLLPAILHATGAQLFTVALLSGGKALIAKVVANPSPNRPTSVPASDANLSLEFDGMNEIFWYDPRTYVVHDVAIPAQQAEFRLTATTALRVAARI